MKEIFVGSCYNFINSKKTLDHYNQIKIKYGLEVMYHFLTKTFVVLIISYLLGILKQNIYIFLFYGVLRTFSHGVHAGSNLKCWITTLTTYCIFGYLFKIISFTRLSEILISMLCVTSIIILSPSDTKYRPIRSRKKRINLKIKATIVSFIYLFIVLLNLKLKKYFMFSLILCSIVINPITYKLFGLVRDNYKKI